MHQLHIALNVQDLGTSVEFYSTVFEIRPDKETAAYARFTVEDPPLVLALNTKTKVRSGERISHLGIRLAQNGALSRFRERLLAADLVRKEESQVLCCHSIQNKLWVRDPDGNHWEFYELLEDLDPQAALADGRKGCC